MPSNCEVVIEPATIEAGTTVLRVRGDIDGGAKALMPAAYADAVAANNPRSVLLDFTAVDYINSTGIAVIVGILAQARADGRTVSASGLTEHYKHIFTITRLVDFIQLVDAVPAHTAEG